MDLGQSVNDFFTHLAGQGISLLEPIVAVGILAMAIIQTLKDLLPIRRWFQAAFVGDWLEARRRTLPDSTNAGPGKAEEDLVRLATAGDERAFFELPIEQLCGQMNAAMQVALDYPKLYEPLVRLVAASAQQSDVKLLIDSWEEQAQRLDSLDPGTRDPLVQARARVAHATQRAIDALQIAAGSRWKLYLQLTAFGLSFVITAFAASAGASAGTTEWPKASVLLYGLAGGFLAPVARDLLASLQQIGRRA